TGCAAQGSGDVAGEFRRDGQLEVHFQADIIRIIGVAKGEFHFVVFSFISQIFAAVISFNVNAQEFNAVRQGQNSFSASDPGIADVFFDGNHQAVLIVICTARVEYG